MRRFIILFIVLLLFITSIVSCGDNNKENNSDETTSSKITEATVETGDSRPPLNVPVKDYGGYQFRILSIHTVVMGHTTYMGNNYYSNFTSVQERAGEPINDAVYYRNLKILEEFNVEIVNVEVADVYAQARKVIQSGDDLYDMITPSVDTSFQLAQDKFIYNLYDVPYINLENPWWDQVLIDNLSLNKKLFTATGDISFGAQEENVALVVNKVLMEQYNINNLYDIVRDGKWTFDKMREIGVNVTHDLNGDGVIDFNDVYAIGNDYTSGQFFYYATGEKIAVLDKDGSPKLTVGGERSITVMDKIIEIMNDKNLMIWTATIVRDAKVDGWEYLLKMFNENRLLIYQVSVFCIKELRGMFDDFAIVPHPKYNEFQDDYYMIVSTHRCPGVCIPVTNTELELTGIILEAMAYYSQPIQVAYYDVTLTEKFARDADSRDMLDIIFGGRTYDIGKTFGWGSYIVQMDTAINKNEAFASYYEANRTKAETEMQKSYGIFLEV